MRRAIPVKLATTVVGSYPQPEWLIDGAMFGKGVPRVRRRGLWRIPDTFLEQAQDDARSTRWSRRAST